VTHAPIAPRDRLPVWLKAVYGASRTVSYFGGQLLKVPSASIFVAGMGMSPASIGIIFLIFRLWDGMIDPLLGWLSDNTRSRWGRRRPAPHRCWGPTWRRTESTMTED